VSRFQDQVAAALSAVRITDSSGYTWLGRRRRPLAASIEAGLSETERRRILVSCLGEELYRSFYCHGGPVLGRRGLVEPPADPRLGAALSRANSGQGSWEPGWTVERLDGEEAVVAGPRLIARIPVRDCRALTGGVHPGAPVSVRMPKEMPTLSPGFFTVLSDVPADLAAAESVVRVYWNVTAGAPALVEAISLRLNAGRTPFRLKVADHPFRFDRRDSAVLYLDGESFRALRDTLQELAVTLSAHLNPGIPAFTLELAPGVGLAEAGGDGESFGTRRCLLLADAIVRAHAQGVNRPDARVETVAARFAEDGVRIDAPYLEPSLAGRHVL
jgi:hypothetical protein